LSGTDIWKPCGHRILNQHSHAKTHEVD
jgi:hypothetical protein